MIIMYNFNNHHLLLHFAYAVNALDLTIQGGNYKMSKQANISNEKKLLFIQYIYLCSTKIEKVIHYTM